jgi:putative ABC transport system substrate-binding protein
MFIQLAGSILLAGMHDAHAQKTGKLWRIGYLANGVRPADGAAPATLRNELRALGLAEGKEIVFETRWAGGRNDLLRGLAGELVSSNVDLIVAFGGPAAEAAKRASSTIPIVAMNAGDMVDTGLVSTLGRPGGNVTGVNDPAAVLSGKRLEILKELVPAATRIAVIWNADNLAMTLRYRAIERVAKSMRMSVDPFGVREPDDFGRALVSMKTSRPDALMMLTDALTNLNRQRILDFVSSERIPAIYEFDYLVQAGGLISYGSDQGDILKLAAGYVAKILKGARPGELPVEQPNRYFLVVNVRTAIALGITVPQSLLLRADALIQ